MNYDWNAMFEININLLIYTTFFNIVLLTPVNIILHRVCFQKESDYTEFSYLHDPGTLFCMYCICASHGSLPHTTSGSVNKLFNEYGKTVLVLSSFYSKSVIGRVYFIYFFDHVVKNSLTILTYFIQRKHINYVISRVRICIHLHICRECW